MLNARNTYCAAFISVALLCLGTESLADTQVHGYSIPTAEGPRAPSIAVCSSLSNPIENGRQGRLADRRATGMDSRRYSASICIPVGADSGTRKFTTPVEVVPSVNIVIIPIEVVNAIEIVEHSLVAHFDHNSAEFDDIEALPALDIIVSWMLDTPRAGIKLQGHTDATGSPEYNLELAHQRVAAVKALLVKKGVPATRIRAEWYGENKLLRAVLGRLRDNRRVDIEVYQIVEGEILADFVPPEPIDASTLIGTGEVAAPVWAPVLDDPNYVPLPFPLDED